MKIYFSVVFLLFSCTAKPRQDIQGEGQPLRGNDDNTAQTVYEPTPAPSGGGDRLLPAAGSGDGKQDESRLSDNQVKPTPSKPVTPQAQAEPRTLEPKPAPVPPREDVLDVDPHALTKKSGDDVACLTSTKLSLNDFDMNIGDEFKLTDGNIKELIEKAKNGYKGELVKTDKILSARKTSDGYIIKFKNLPNDVYSVNIAWLPVGEETFVTYEGIDLEGYETQAFDFEGVPLIKIRVLSKTIDSYLGTETGTLSGIYIYDLRDET